jgi:murein DD-endopeptidase MepM/ murein hydrolase activator NlpD
MRRTRFGGISFMKRESRSIGLVCRRWCDALLLAILLSACGFAVPTAEPSPVIAPLASTPNPALTATVPPLRFVLPAPGAEPVSGWRPPLYPVPWAVSAYDHFYFTRPNPADQVNWPLPDYRYGGVFFSNVVHTGIDIDAKEGTMVMAAGPGIVVWAGWGLFTESPLNKDDPYGLAVAIRHDFGYQGQQLFTVYAHMSQVDVTLGQYVQTGDQLGLVGATGKTTGPHLHFEVRLGNNSFHTTLNPELWLSPPQGWGVLVGRLSDKKNEPLELYAVHVTSEETGKVRTVRTYGTGAVNPDPYYRENMALSDLPAGLYRVNLVFDKKNLQFWVEIFPGQVTYFTFNALTGFQLVPPPTPSLDFLPITPTATPIPTKRP